MRINTLFYTLRQGFRNIFRNKWFTLASIATIGACLFLFGLFYAIVVNFQHIVKNAEQGVSVTVFFDAGLEDTRIQEIGEMIARRTEVSNVHFVSADEAWQSFKQDYLGEYADGFTENPLANSANYQIYLSDVSMQSALVTYLESIPGVRRVNRDDADRSQCPGSLCVCRYHCHFACSVDLPDQQYDHDRYFRQKRRDQYHEIYRSDGFLRQIAFRDRRYADRTDRSSDSARYHLCFI